MYSVGDVSVTVYAKLWESLCVRCLGLIQMCNMYISNDDDLCVVELDADPHNVAIWVIASFNTKLACNYSKTWGNGSVVSSNYCLFGLKIKWSRKNGTLRCKIMKGE